MKNLRVLAAASVMVFAFCSPSAAAITEPVVTVVTADTSTMTLTLEGFNLPNGAVYMGKVGGGVQKLRVTGASATAIVAELPTAVPGTYVVAILTSPDRFWTSSVTIGAAGPPGPPGPTGEPGPAGVQGPSGIVTTLYTESNVGPISFQATLAGSDKVCVFGSYTAGANEKALLDGAVVWQDATAETASGYPAYSNDGGTLWADKCGSMFMQGTNAAGAWGGFSRRCALPLTEGLTYTFGMMLASASPSAAFTSDGGRCELQVIIAKE